MDTILPITAIVTPDKLLAKVYGQALVARGAEVLVVTNEEELKRHRLAEIFAQVLVIDSSTSPDLRELVMTTLVLPQTQVVNMLNFGSKEEVDNTRANGAVGYIVKATTSPLKFADSLYNIVSL